MSVAHPGYRRLTDPQVTCEGYECEAEHLGALRVSPTGTTSVACEMGAL